MLPQTLVMHRRDGELRDNNEHYAIVVVVVAKEGGIGRHGRRPIAWLAVLTRSLCFSLFLFALYPFALYP